jgi:phosphatidylserine decarboxylase
MVASEGKIVIIPIILIFFIGIFINHLIDDSLSWLKYFNYFSFSFLLFTLYFFRNPKRKPLGTSNQMVSPSDGKVIQIINIDDPDISNAKQISIFLSIFNVHSQHVPIDSSVISSNYFSGKYLLAFNHKTSSKNEQSTTLFKTKENNKYKIKQIAGFIARRILNYMESDQSVIKGQRLGFIRFGSRVEIIVSSNNFDVIVKKGDKIKANISTIGIFK